MTRIAQVSDVHFGSEDPATVQSLIDELNAAALDLVILSGDLTLAARNDEFRRARAFIDALDAPTLSVPGNHDITPWNVPERMLLPYRRWRRHVGPALEPTWSNDDVAVVGLNTARRMRFKLDWSLGSLSRAQIGSLGRRFGATGPTAFRIIVAHHPFLPEEGVNLDDRPHAIVHRAQRALAAFVDQRVDIVLAGHLHRTYAAHFKKPEDVATTVTEAGEPAHRVTVIQAGTALSSRTRNEANAYNLIQISDHRLAVHAVVWGAGAWSRAATPLAVLQRPSAMAT